jgi:prephenate dehydrogenase
VTADSSTECLVIVGVGLIGGSIGLAAKQRGQFKKVIGVGRDLSTFPRIRSLGCVDEMTTDLAGAAARADVLVICTPVDRIAEQVLSVERECKPGSLITDAGSAKAALVAEVERKFVGEAQFVGSHPLAGSEKKGPEHARADLFDGRLTLITPTNRTPKAAIERAARFWESLGSRVKQVSPEFHDEALAVTSHLPHLVAAALAEMLPVELAEFTATGFRDATRLAAGDPQLWSAIFSQNNKHISEALDRFQERLSQFQAALAKGDRGQLDQLLSEAKKVRDDLGN